VPIGLEKAIGNFFSMLRLNKYFLLWYIASTQEQRIPKQIISADLLVRMFKEQKLSTNVDGVSLKTIHKGTQNENIFY
jgi:hypothetical protein